MSHPKGCACKRSFFHFESRAPNAFTTCAQGGMEKQECYTAIPGARRWGLTKIGVSKYNYIKHQRMSIHPYLEWHLLQLCLRIEQQAHDPACRGSAKLKLTFKANLKIDFARKSSPSPGPSLRAAYLRATGSMGTTERSA
eukprot:s1341_g5.t1